MLRISFINVRLAQLYLQQDKNHAEELERARQRRSVSNSVPDFHSKKSQNDKNYDDSFDSISDIPQPRVINRSSPSKLAQQTDSESIEELIEAAVNPRTTNSVSEKIASDSIDELIQGATSYVHKVKEPKKEQLKQQFYSEGTAKAKNYSAAEFQLKLVIFLALL